MMERVLYALALVTLVTVPATLVAWFLIHRFVGYWRRIGRAKVLAALTAVTLLTMLVMYLVREPLLRQHFGFNRPMAWAAAVLLALSSYINVLVYRRAPMSMALGLDEISPDEPGCLVTGGIYGRMRHPRFVAMSIAVAAMALLTNHAVVYLMFAVYVVTIRLIAALEDRELAMRFGSRYREYAGTVARFLPRSGGK